MAYTTFSTVESIIGKVSQDIRNQLAFSAGSPGISILIDYVNRTHKQVLRFSRWGFLLSEPQYFMTAFGQTDYWIGPSSQLPVGPVDTLLELYDVDKLKKDEVRDFSNDSTLKPLGGQPIGPTLNFRSGQARQDQPRAWYQDWNDPNLLHIWPGPDNENTFQPQPPPPNLSNALVSGVLPQRTYYVRTTFTDSIGGESQASNISTTITIPVNQLCTVVSPGLKFAANASGILYSGYNVYASLDPTLGGQAEGNETLQNSSPIAVGTNWTEPTSGLTTTGRSPSTTATIAQMEGYVIGFRYYKTRMDLTVLTQQLQVPNDYDDVIIQGVQYLCWKLLGKKEEAMASQQAYKEGLTEIVTDKNLFPDIDFIRPDSGTFVNQQILGYLPPFF